MCLAGSNASIIIDIQSQLHNRSYCSDLKVALLDMKSLAGDVVAYLGMEYQLDFS